MIKPISSYLFHADQKQLGAYTLSAELLHVARRTINTAAITFSFSTMLLAPFILGGAHPDLLNLVYLMKLSAQLGLIGGIGGAGYGLGELSQRTLN